MYGASIQYGLLCTVAILRRAAVHLLGTRANSAIGRDWELPMYFLLQPYSLKAPKDPTSSIRAA